MAKYKVSNTIMGLSEKDFHEGDVLEVQDDYPGLIELVRVGALEPTELEITQPPSPEEVTEAEIEQAAKEAKGAKFRANTAK